MSDDLQSISAEMPDLLAEYSKQLDQAEIERHYLLSRDASLVYKTVEFAGPPPQVDHSGYISYVRNQGAYGCGIYAAAAVWDMCINKYCYPYFHPNISVNRMLWAWKLTSLCTVPEGAPCSQRKRGRIPGPNGVTYPSVDSYMLNFGCATEGSEPTDSDAVAWPSDEGNLEAPNYRSLKHQWSYAAGAGLDTPAFKQLVAEVGYEIASSQTYFNAKVDLNDIKYFLAGAPVRAGVRHNHFVALVGYDDATARIKFLNSWGDRWGENGYGYIDYAKIQEEIDSIQVYTFNPPQSLPCAKISLKSGWRQDVNLWLGIEGKPAVKHIWPNGQRQDDSLNLSFIVTLLRGFNWPPAPGNRIYLDVYDSGAHSSAGGTIEEFTVGHCAQYYHCADAPGGGATKAFKPQELLRLTIP